MMEKRSEVDFSGSCSSFAAAPDLYGSLGLMNPD
jgi:hypothetical protein